jgi:hypothetical protein
MPIEIRELNIKVSVNRNQEEGDIRPLRPGELPSKDEIIAECVEQVMELLKKKNER